MTEVLDLLLAVKVATHTRKVWQENLNITALDFATFHMCANGCGCFTLRFVPTMLSRY